jgi:hypothetical protein
MSTNFMDQSPFLVAQLVKKLLAFYVPEYWQ